ncbi:MAG: glycosyltransferase family 4 protein [bacterium]|nr:glycosyltransferase family 4 protein [bacterium]
MKILHINWSGEIGGAETFVYNLAFAQKESHNDVTIAYMAKSSILGLKAQKTGIKTIEFNMCSGFDIIKGLKYVKFIRKEKFDIIHDHNGPPIVRLSKVFSGKSTFIQHIHGTKWGNIKWEKREVILWKRITNKFVDCWIANSEHTKKIASLKERIHASNIKVVYNGINLSEFKLSRGKSEIKKEFNIGKNDFIVGTVARLAPPKGIDNFIEVAKRIDNPDIKFIIVGEGELENKLKLSVKEMNLQDKVIFTGAREDIPDILSIFDIFLSTSKWEAFGITIIEAMAVGLPVVAFAVDGIKEIVKENCGILVPYPNVDKVVETISFLKDNPAKRKEMGINGMEYVSNYFDIKITEAKIKALYEEVQFTSLWRNKLCK